MNEWYNVGPRDHNAGLYDPDPGPMAPTTSAYLEPYVPEDEPKRRPLDLPRPLPALSPGPPLQDPWDMLDTLWAQLVAIEYQVDGMIRRLPEVHEPREASTPSAQEILDLHHLAQAIAPTAAPETEPVVVQNAQDRILPTLEDLIDGEFQ